MNQNDVLERLARQNPVPPEALRGLADSPVAQAMLERVVASEPETPGAAPRARRVRRRTKIAAAVAIAAVVSLVAVLLAIVPGPGNAPANAAQLLRRASRTAAAQPAPAAGSIGYQATAARVAETFDEPGGPFTVFVDTRSRIWVAPNRSGRQVSSQGEATFPSRRDRVRWKAAGSPDVSRSANIETFGPDKNPFYDLSGLSDDPSVLVTQIPGLLGEKHVSNVSLFDTAGELLAQPDASPSLRAALYQVLAGLPGVELLGPTTDPAGRHGVGVAITSASSGLRERTTLIVDPHTSAMLAREVVLLQRSDTIGATPPVTLDSTTYLASGTAHSEREVPPSSNP